MKSGPGVFPLGRIKTLNLLQYLFAAVALCTVVWVRVRLLQTPFERDEGEYAYAGSLILQGFPPYLHALSMKLPGMFYLNALMLKTFGATVAGVHRGLLVVNLGSALLLFLIAARLFGRSTGAVAAGLFMLMTVSQQLLGTFAHATHFVILFVLAAYVLLLSPVRSSSPWRFVSAGLFLGMALTVKQHGALFLVAAMLFVLLDTIPLKTGLKNSALMMAGFAVPYAVVAFVVILQGTFSTFWFWTVTYASSYATGLTPLLGWMNLKSQLADIFSSMLPYWLLALVGLLAVTFGKSHTARRLLLPLGICSFLALCPGYYFRPHYFILAVPVVALFVAALFDSIPTSGGVRKFLVALLLGAALFQLWTERWFLFTATPEEYLKQAYQTTKPFVETEVVARYIKENTRPGDRIVVFGSEPQIYFYSGRQSATGHIYMYPLMEEQPYAARMQSEMLAELHAARPVYVVLVDDLSSWLAVSDQGTAFRRGLNDFVRNGYELDGVAAVSRNAASFYVFGERARQFVPNSSSRIFLYKLKQQRS